MQSYNLENLEDFIILCQCGVKVELLPFDLDRCFRLGYKMRTYAIRRFRLVGGSVFICSITVSPEILVKAYDVKRPPWPCGKEAAAVVVAELAAVLFWSVAAFANLEPDLACLLTGFSFFSFSAACHLLSARPFRQGSK